MNATLTSSDNKIGDEGAVAIGEALKINQTLQLIDLSCKFYLIECNSLTSSVNQIGDKGAVALGEALKINQTLQVINLSCKFY